MERSRLSTDWCPLGVWCTVLSGDKCELCLCVTKGPAWGLSGFFILSWVCGFLSTAERHTALPVLPSLSEIRKQMFRRNVLRRCVVIPVKVSRGCVCTWVPRACVHRRVAVSPCRWAAPSPPAPCSYCEQHFHAPPRIPLYHSSWIKPCASFLSTSVTFLSCAHAPFAGLSGTRL